MRIDSETLSPQDLYKIQWSMETTRKIESHLAGMHRYVQKHSAAYAWHGANMTAPTSLSDGDKICILKEILQEREK